MNKLLIIFLCFVYHLGQAQNKDSEQPNILFILADDLGINALNCYGNPLVESPNIDKLYAEGMHFSNGYSNDPTCAPSRASILSGQYVPRHQVYRVVDRFKQDQKTLGGMKYLPPKNYTLKGSGAGLALNKMTIAEALKDNGYATVAYGKWHLGHNELQIQNQGFDEGFEIIGHYNFKTFPKQDHIDTSLYSADYITEKTISFIKKVKANHTPFFAFVPYYLVHKPLEPKKEYLNYFKDKLKANTEVGPDEIKVLAMIKSLDESVGNLLSALKALGLEDNTIVVFTSDNGHYKTESNIFNQPYRGTKGETFEGGIRVPYIFKWPNHIQPNTINSEPIIHVDIYPTLLGLTNTNKPIYYNLDGEDISPILLRKANKTNRDALVWEYTNYAGYNPKSNTFKSQWVNVIQMNGFKLTELIENESYYMFNLNKDPYETKDVFKEYPKEAAKLKARMEQWKKETGYVGPVKNPDYKNND